MKLPIEGFELILPAFKPSFLVSGSQYDLIKFQEVK